jgi:hypothetical protein
MSEEELICTGDLNGPVQAHIDEYRALFAELRATERISDGFRWRFPATLEPRVRAQASREAECCKFFRFSVVVEGDEVVWETRAAESARAVVEEFQRLPHHLAAEPRPGHDVALLQGVTAAAGLRFTGSR